MYYRNQKLCVVSSWRRSESRTMFSDLQAPCKMICGTGNCAKWVLSLVMLDIFLRALTGL